MTCRLLAFALAAASLLGCSGGDPSVSGDGGGSTTAGSGGTTPMACIPGQQVQCACLGGADGIQVCRADGSGYDPCQCSSATSSGGQAGAGGTTGLGGFGGTGGLNNTGGATTTSSGTEDPCANCDDGDPCTIDTCLSGQVCEHMAVGLDDGNSCTMDYCDGSGVQHVAIPINDNNVCTLDGCDITTGPYHQIVDPSDGNACTTDECDPVAGVTHVQISIDDANPCTQDLCDQQTGEVTHPPVNSSDGNACTSDSCDPATGITHTAVLNDDNNACTSDSCDPASGVQHAPNWTADWNPCTSDSCDPATGTVTRTPLSNCWAPISNSGAPSARTQHYAVWTGSKMVVWGGLASGNQTNTGAVYDPATNTWTPTWPVNSPSGSWSGVAVWFESKMTIMGGWSLPGPFATGAQMYDPTAVAWSAMGGPASQPIGWEPSAVIASNQLIFFGGHDGGGARKSGWRFLNTTPGINGNAIADAPVGRFYHSAISTGTELIVYGGLTGGGYPVEAGHLYDPGANMWTPIPAEPPPHYPYRWQHVGVWTGSKMIVWGGLTAPGPSPQDPQTVLGSGNGYTPATEAWSLISSQGAPQPRYGATVVWTGSKMIVWGGLANMGGPALGTGGVYDATSDTWLATSAVNQPLARSLHVAVWTGQGMIIWGGEAQNGVDYGNGAIYYP